MKDELKEGDQVLVKVLGIEGNRIKLSRKAILREQRAKMAAANGGAAPDASPAPSQPQASSEETVTFEGGGNFDENEEEPNFNREESNRETVSAGGHRDRGDRGDRPRGGGGGGRHGGRRHRRGGRPPRGDRGPHGGGGGGDRGGHRE